MPTLQIRERDIEILRAVHQFRVLKSQDHLQRLFGGSDRIPRRLDQLSGAGYLYRFKRPHIRSQYYYGLGNQGATLLSDRLGWPRTRVNWRLKNQRLKDKHLDHTFMIADVMIAVELAAQELDGVRFISPEEVFTRSGSPQSAKTWFTQDRFHQGEKRFKVSAFIKPPGIVGHEATIYGDWIFGLEFDGERGKTQRYFMLEADRGGMPVDTNNFNRRSIVQKMFVYLECGKRKKTTNRSTRQEKHSSTIFEELYGIPNIRTLFVIDPTEGGEGEKRIQTCIDTCKKITNGRGSKQFLFALASWPESPTLLTDFLLDGTGSSMSLLPKVSEPVAS